MTAEPGILADLPPNARYVTLRLRAGADPRPSLSRLAKERLGASVVVGIGASVVRALGRSIAGLHELPALAGPGAAVPSTPAGLWLWIRGEERGALVHRARALVGLVDEAFEVEDVRDGFLHAGGRDLSGYEDGTENPRGERAREAALWGGDEPGLSGSSFVAVQVWRHALERLEAMTPEARDACIGRRLADNEEMADAPPSAHVKRSAQESFEPAAFMVRRSMPWADERGEGLVFVAFGRSLAAFEAVLGRMVGAEDGIVDALFRFTRPLSGAAFWCPPARGEGLDLRALGI